MANEFKQSDYYSVEKVKERLRSVLGSDEWENLKDTDVGEVILSTGSNIVHQDAMAFFTGLDQFFLSTNTLAGYLEEIAKSNRVIPETYTSASITVTLYSKGSPRTFAPMDLSIIIGGNKFYNIEDVTINTIASPSTIIMYEGSVIRQATETGKAAGNLWYYSKLNASIPVKVGEKVIRRYLLLPKNIFVSSIMVESSQSFLLPFTRWIKTDKWYNKTNVSRAWLLDKDFIGRYKIEFGDGVYGRTFPTEEILGVRYLISSGSGITISDFTSYKLYYQDTSDISSSFVVGSISNLVDGTSELDTDDLKLKIEEKQNTREGIIFKDSHKVYLESRPDVKSAQVIVERDSSPPNSEMFNVISYAIKPNQEGGAFNDAEIKAYFAKFGIETVDYVNIAAKVSKFNIGVKFKVLTGYSVSTVQDLISTAIETEFSWDNLEFEETVSTARIQSLLSDIEGLDLQSLTISVEVIYTDPVSGSVVWNFSIGNIISLQFYPRRFNIKMSADEFVPGTTARDDGVSKIYADILAQETFNLDTANIGRASFITGNMLFLSDGTQTTYKLIELKKSQGGTSKVVFPSIALNSVYVDRYSEVACIESDGGGSWRIRTYSFPERFFNPDDFNYLQIKETYTVPSYVKDSGTLSGILSGTTGPQAMVYHNSYLYVVFARTSATSYLVRYRISTSAIELDTDYNQGNGFLALAEKDYVAINPTESIFDNEDVIWLTTGSSIEIDAVREFTSVDGCYFEQNFLSTAFGTSPVAPETIDGWKDMTTDGNNLYGIATVSDGSQRVLKIYSIHSDGDAGINTMSDDTLTDMRSIDYNNYNGVESLFIYDATAFKVFYLDDMSAQDIEPSERAGTGVAANDSSITTVADVAYDLNTITMTLAMTNAKLWYVVEGDIEFTGVEMAVLNELTVIEK